MIEPTSKLLLVEQAGDEGRIATVDKPLFTIGRAVGMDLQLENRIVSSRHAVIKLQNEQWLIEDLGSTNGTFVNGEQVTVPRVIKEDDVVAFARVAYRVAEAVVGDGGRQPLTSITAEISSAMDLTSLLEQGGVFSVFQPIYELSSGRAIAFEALGRGVSHGQQLSPSTMFSLAELEHRTAQLSRALSDAALGCLRCAHCWAGQQDIEIWLNLHPLQLSADSLEDELQDVAAAAKRGGFRVVVEAPEAWVSRSDEMERLTALVRQLEMRLAYDDFGAGQARFQDLQANPPDYLKFDRLLIEDLHGDPVKQEILRVMVTACDQLGIRTLAEGIEEQSELDVCRQLGISLVQGYLFERPLQAFDLFRSPPIRLPPDCQHRRLGLV